MVAHGVVEGVAVQMNGVVVASFRQVPVERPQMVREGQIGEFTGDGTMRGSLSWGGPRTRPILPPATDIPSGPPEGQAPDRHTLT
ncbi:hypothetical protein SVIO_010820 [Streptomyces violaceusniger]|uniref:Uncharacterized protein n=1 Tax=Streptomyces violaceusniger TaxID=68280 RepID=A0A4D4KX90_STRVO|nr:hypothetical protein SVIO_010820 [Streptomyces violaceusniger]